MHSRLVCSVLQCLYRPRRAIQRWPCQSHQARGSLCHALMQLSLSRHGAALTRVSAACAQQPVADMRNAQNMVFLLNLEYLLANFYSCAVSGQGVAAALRGGGPAPAGCTRAAFDTPATQARVFPRVCPAVYRVAERRPGVSGIWDTGLCSRPDAL